MANNVQSLNPARLYSSLLRCLPGLVAGVFISRVAGEWIGLPGWLAAVGLCAVFGGVGAWLTYRWPLGHTWPALLLAAYIFYPEPSPTFALQIGILTLLAAGLNWYSHAHGSSNENSAESTGPRNALLVAGLLATGFFILYALTIAPDVLAADSGELQVVAAQLGVAHPPGFPLYILLAHLSTRLLFFTSPAVAVNLLSALFSALAVGMVYLAGTLITRSHLPGVVAGVVLGTATTFWAQATTANVRSLTALFTALILFMLFAYREAIHRGDRRSADSRLIVTALIMVFGVTHHISLIFLTAIGLIFIVAVDPGLLREPHRWWRPLAAGLLGLFPLLYLPWRASAAVRGASPGLATWPGFLEHVLATGFRGDLFYYTSPADLFQRLRVMANVVTFQFDLIVVAAMAVGVGTLLARNRRLALLLVGTFALFTLVAATYRAPQTVEYMIPAYVAAALLVGYAFAAALAFAGWPGRIPAPFGTVLAALIVLASLNQALANKSAAGALHEGTSTREFTGHLLAEAPPDSVILAHWHWATPLWYLQEVEGRRPDVDVRFVYPEGEPYEQTWARRTQEAYATGRPVITTWISTSALSSLPLPEPIGEAYLYRQEPLESLPATFVETGLTLGDVMSVEGYRLDPPDSAVVAGEEIVLTIGWRPLAEMENLSFYVHIVGADGEIYGQDDRIVSANEAGLTLTQFRATSRPGLPPEPVSVYLGINGESGGRILLTEVDVELAQHPPYTRNETSKRLVDNLSDVLIGYDWDHSLTDQSRLYLHWRRGNEFFTQVVDDTQSIQLPPYRGLWGVASSEWQFPRGRTSGHYVPLGQGIVWTGETVNGLTLSPGESVVIDQEFHSSRVINRDLIVSVRLIGLEADGIHWDWWDLQDSVPAMGAIPTLKWIDGSFVRSPHRVSAPETAPSGQELTGALTLYDAFTNRPVPILDERMTAENPWVPLCRGVVE